MPKKTLCCPDDQRRAVLSAALDAVTTGFDPDKGTEGSSIKSANIPMALEAAADAGDHRIGQALFRSDWALASSPIIFWNSRTMVGKGWGPAAVPSR